MRYRTSVVLVLWLAACGSDDATDDFGGAPDGTSTESSTLDATSDSSPADSHGESDADAHTDGGIDGEPDVGSDVATDVVTDVATDVATDVVTDVATDVVTDVVADVVTDVAEASSGIISVRVGSKNDALASYLMNLSPPAWNIFYGETVPVGRHFDSGHVSYHTAFRFVGVAIPKGAPIASARLRFFPTNEVDSSHALWLNVYAERTGNSAPFDPSNYTSGRPDQRLKTLSFIDRWLVRCNASCTDMTEYDCPQRKLDCWNRSVAFEVPKDLRSLVQEVVDQADWVSGNALTIFLINSATDADGSKYESSRSITGYDIARGAEYSPELTITLGSP